MRKTTTEKSCFPCRFFCVQDSFLSVVASHRFLTSSQLSSLIGSSSQGVRRRIRGYRSKGLVSEPFRLLGSNGRPEDCHSLTQAGYDSIGFKGKRVKRVAMGEHQYMQNWFLIALELFLDSNPEFSAKTFVSTSPLRDRPYACKIPKHPGGSLDCTFAPDISMKLTKNEKSLLFFVEIDCGTESLTGQRSIKEKIERYRIYRGTKLYKYFEKPFQVHFKGFRLLFVAPDKDRLDQLCAVTRATSPSDFVWLAKLESVKASFGEAIWHQGGTDKLSSLFNL